MGDFFYVVGIPTFRRPTLLKQLLESLVPETAGKGVLVVVADNDCGTDVPAVCQEFAHRLDGLVVLGVATRGISANRNALVDAAYEHAPGWRWLIMLDDDGQVQPEWFAELTKVARESGAHVTGGAVVCPLPPGAGDFARNSEFALRQRWSTGRVQMLGVAQNTCIARATERLVRRPWFDSAYGMSGGEDHEFFLRLSKAGGSFAWADEAVVVEPQPPERLSSWSVLYRSLTTGITTARIERQHGGVWSSAAATLRYTGLVLGGLVVNALTLRKDKFIRTIIGAAYTLGRYPGVGRLAGRRYEKVTRV